LRRLAVRFLPAGAFAAGLAELVFRVAEPVFALVAVERFAAGFFAVERFGAAFACVFAAGRLADVLLAPELERAELDCSIGHLPDITFCAASATASAIKEPSRVALAVTDFAAFSAVSAASIPASLIALRALGLAAIAAAAAVSPAASISLLIAALVILSMVSLDLELDDFEALLRLVGLAIANLRYDSPV
jgi:hypothetical protein